MSKARTVDLKLEFPVEWKGKQIKEITIRRNKGRDNRFMPKGADVGPEDMYPFFLQLISANGEPLDEDFIDEMDGGDLNSMAEVITGFLSRKKASPASRTGAR